MYKDFRHFCHQAHPKPGDAWVWKGFGKHIVSLFTQEPPTGDNNPPGRASIIHVNHALRELVRLVEKEGFQSVALSRLATGVGGLDWEEVKPVVYHFLEALPVPVYVYTHFSKGMKAAE